MTSFGTKGRSCRRSASDETDCKRAWALPVRTGDRNAWTLVIRSHFVTSSVASTAKSFIVEVIVMLFFCGSLLYCASYLLSIDDDFICDLSNVIRDRIPDSKKWRAVIKNKNNEKEGQRKISFVDRGAFARENKPQTTTFIIN